MFVSGIYTTFVMMMNTWSVMLTVLVLNLHHRNGNKPIPKWVRAFVFEGLARILCMYSTTQRQKRDYHKMVAITTVGINSKNKNQRGNKKNQMKDGYSISFASPKYSSSSHHANARVGSPGLFASDTSATVNRSPHTQSTPDGHHTASNTTYSANDEFNNKNKDVLENLNTEEQNNYGNYQLQEWKRVARIVDGSSSGSRSSL